MSAGDQISRIAPYLARAFEDEYIQEQIEQAVRGLRESSRRARKQSASDAIKDQRLRSQLRDAFNSFTKASQALAEPPRKQHWTRRVLLLVLVAAAIAEIVYARQDRSIPYPTS